MAFYTGLKYPIELTNGSPVLATDIELIKSNLNNLLGWALKTRFFNPKFKNRAAEVLEEPMDLISEKLIISLTKDAIREFEPRITCKDTTVTNRGFDSITIRFICTLNKTQQPFTFDYPFNKD